MKGERNACAPLAPHGVRSAKRLALAKGKLLRSMRESGLRRDSPLRGKGCVFPARERVTKGVALTRGGSGAWRNSPLQWKRLCVPHGEPEYKGHRPWEGVVLRSRRGSGITKGVALTESGSGACPKPRLLGDDLYLLSTCRPPGRGRGDVMGLRPLRSPLPTPRSTPLGFPGGHCSHGSVGF